MHAKLETWGASEIVYFRIETQKEKAFPTWIVAPIVIVAAVGTTLLVYFVKVKKVSTSQEKQITDIGASVGLLCDIC